MLTAVLAQQYASVQDMYPPYNQDPSSYRQSPGQSMAQQGPFADAHAPNAYTGGSPHQQQQQQYGYSDYAQQQHLPQSGYSPYAGDNGYSNNSRPYLPSKDSYGSQSGGMGAGAAAGAGIGAAAGASSSRKQAQTTSWMEGGGEPSTGMSKKAKWWIAIGVLLVLAGAGGGIAAWQVLKKNNDSSSSSSSVSSTNKNGGSGTSISGDPSDFTKDSNLKQSFYAMGYSPSGSILPTCGANLAEVQRDIQLLSQLTTRIRTYGSDCNASTLVMQAIQDTKVDMTVWLGIYIDTDESIWERQRDDTLAIIQKYGVDHISGITVGNEFLLNTNGAASSYTSIRQKVAEFKSELAKLSLSKTIPVGTADAGSMITAALSSSADYVMANVHPW